MKSVVIFQSVHKGNTRKIAEALAGELKAKLVKPGEIDVNNLNDYDLIGFGSGIYFGKHHQDILDLAEKILPAPGKKVFIFSTAGLPQLKFIWHGSLKNKLKEKGFNIVGEFSCAGHDEVGPLKMIGGINKGRPDENDIDKAKQFANSLSIIISQETTKLKLERPLVGQPQDK